MELYLKVDDHFAHQQLSYIELSLFSNAFLRSYVPVLFLFLDFFFKFSLELYQTWYGLFQSDTPEFLMVTRHDLIDHLKESI